MYAILELPKVTLHSRPMHIFALFLVALLLTTSSLSAQESEATLIDGQPVLRFTDKFGCETLVNFKKIGDQEEAILVRVGHFHGGDHGERGWLGITRDRVFFSPDAGQKDEHAFNIPRNILKAAKVSKDHDVFYLTISSIGKKNQEFSVLCFGSRKDPDDTFVGVLKYAVLACNDYDAGLREFQRLTANLQPQNLQDDAVSLNNLAILNLNNGNVREAERLLLRALDISEKTLGPVHLNTAQVLFNLGDTYRGGHDYHKAEAMYRRALEIRVKALGAEHSLVATSLTSIASLFQLKGDYARAEQLFQRALSVNEKTLGPDNGQIVSFLGSLGFFYGSMGKFSLAEQYHRRALAITEKAWGPESPNLLNALHNLGSLYQYLTYDYRQAESLYQRALLIAQRVRGSDHPDTAAVLADLASLYSENGSYSKSEELYQRALAIQERASGSESVNVADVLDQFADFYFGRGLLDTALLMLQRSLAIREKELGIVHPTVAMTLASIGNVDKTRGSYRLASSRFERALSIAEGTLGPNSLDIIYYLDNLAALHKEEGRFQESLDLYLRAVSIIESGLGKEHHRLITFLDSLGSLYQARGEYGQAEQTLRRALSIATSTFGSESRDAIKSSMFLGLLYVAKGDYVGAESFLQRSLDMSERILGPDNFIVAVPTNNLGMLYFHRGDYSRAELLFGRAHRVYARVMGEDNPKTALMLGNLALVYQAKKDYDQANKLGEKVLAVYENAYGPDSINILIPLHNLGSSYALAGDYTRAEKLLHRALTISQKLFPGGHPDQVTVIGSLATIYSEQGNLDRAESFLQRALSLAGEKLGSNHPMTGRVFAGLATLQVAKKNTELAVQYARQAEEISEHNLRLILGAGSDEQKRLYMDSIQWETDGAVSLHLTMAPDNIEAARFALTTIVRRKGRVLDAVRNNMASLRNRLSQQDVGLLDQLSSARSQLSTLVLRGQSTGDVSQFRSEVNRLEDDVQKFESAVSVRSVEFRAISQPVSLEAVQTSIPKEAALVEIVSYKPYDFHARLAEKYGSARYAAYVLKKDGDPKWADLGETPAIDAAIKSLRTALSDRKSSDVLQFARVLDEKVMRPIRRLVGDARMILISPDGALNLVPFGALVDERGTYLLENYSFVYLTSGRDLLRLESRGESRQGPVVIADPLFDLDPNANAKASDLSAGRIGVNRGTFDFSKSRFTPLPGTAAEASALGAILPNARVMTREFATETAVRQLRGPSILHIATHGFFLHDAQLQRAPDRGLSRQLIQGDNQPSQFNLWSLQNPLIRSGLAFAGANIQPNSTASDDAILSAYETAGLDLWGTKLVVLSACDTGVGEIRVGEGVYGLRRALVIAGAETQVTSLWQVDDKATRDLMVDYYTRLQKGLGRGEALRDAQISMLKSANRSHPYYWASFIQLGDWRPFNLRQVSPERK